MSKHDEKSMMTSDEKIEALYKLVLETGETLAKAGVLDLLEQYQHLTRELDLQAYHQRVPFPFVMPHIPPSSLILICKESHVRLRPTHLVVSEETAKYFLLDDFRIGRDTQFVNAESWPLDFFSVTLLSKMSLPNDVFRLKLDTIRAGQKVTLSVRNIDPVHSHTFSALLWCDVGC